MFTFKNKKTPIIADGTQVDHAGLRFTVIQTQYHYNVYLSDPKGMGRVHEVAVIPQAGRWGFYDWRAGVQEVEDAIRWAADEHNAKERANA